MQCRLFIRQLMYRFLWIKELAKCVHGSSSCFHGSVNDGLLVNFVAQRMMVWDAV